MTQEDIDELHRYVTNEATGSAVKAADLDATLPTTSPGSNKLYKDKSGFDKCFSKLIKRHRSQYIIYHLHQ